MVNSEAANRVTNEVMGTVIPTILAQDNPSMLWLGTGSITFNGGGVGAFRVIR